MSGTTRRLEESREKETIIPRHALIHNFLTKWNFLSRIDSVLDAGQKPVALGLASRTFDQYRADVHLVDHVHETVDNSESQRILRTVPTNFYRGT